MEDVVDDFSTLGRVAARLGEWRNSDIESYQSAYVSLVLHRIFSPIVRHHQLFWSPFTSTVAISEQPWFSQVKDYFSFWECRSIFISDMKTLQWLISAGFKTFQLAPYCLGPKETLDEFSEDPDRLLLSSIAEKVPLLLLGGFVSHLTFDWRWWLQSWWPLSALVTTRSQQTRLKGWSVACRGPCKTSHP